MRACLVIRALAATAGALALWAAPVAAEVVPPNVSGKVDIGYAGRHRHPHYAVTLTTPDDSAAILGVGDARVHEVPYSETSQYAVAPTSPLSSGTLRASFGPIGEVSLRFHREGSRRGSSPRRCSGPRPLIERGTYRGTISLRGEGGSFSVNRVSARGIRKRRFALHCPAGATPDPGAARPLASYVAPKLLPDPSAELELEVLTESPGRLLALQALSYSGGALDSRREALLETGPAMTIARQSYIGLPIVFGHFEADDPGASRLAAEIDNATYNADPAAPATWSGEVGAHFLGRIEPVLNGPGSRTRLCAPSTAGSPCVGDPAPLFAGTPFAPVGSPSRRLAARR